MEREKYYTRNNAFRILERVCNSARKVVQVRKKTYGLSHTGAFFTQEHLVPRT